MNHIVKLTKAEFSDESSWNKMIFELDPAIVNSPVLSVELTVSTVFFELET